MSVVEMAIFSMMYDYGMMWRCVLLCFIDPRVRNIRNEASSCLGIFLKYFIFQLFLWFVLRYHIIMCSQTKKKPWTPVACGGSGAKAPPLTARHYVDSSPGSPLPHLLDEHRKLVGRGAIPARSYTGPVRYPVVWF